MGRRHTIPKIVMNSRHKPPDESLLSMNPWYPRVRFEFVNKWMVYGSLGGQKWQILKEALRNVQVPDGAGYFRGRGWSLPYVSILVCQGMALATFWWCHTILVVYVWGLLSDNVCLCLTNLSYIDWHPVHHHSHYTITSIWSLHTITIIHGNNRAFFASGVSTLYVWQ